MEKFYNKTLQGVTGLTEIHREIFRDNI